MQFGRKIRTPGEKKFWEEAYKIGMKNGWCSGEFDRQDGNFIVEEDRLNNNSGFVIEDVEQLRDFFKHGNWCLGQAVIYKSLCFINQINGGDEWLTMKKFKNQVIDFESITFRPTAYEYVDIEGENFKSYGGSKEKCGPKGYFIDFINSLLKAKLVESKNTPGKMVVKY